MAKGDTLKDSIRESNLFRARVYLAGTVAVLVVILILARMVYLQVLNSSHYETLAHANRVNLIPLDPPRGVIYDRNGIVLAENRPSYSLEIIPERVPDMKATLKEVGSLIEITDSDLQRFRTALRQKRRFEGVPLRFQLSDEEVAIITLNRYRLEGVEISSRLARHYPWKELTSHVVGYVGRISEPELKKLDEINYSATTHIGKTGVEKSYEELLHGKVGFREVETNAMGRSLRVLGTKPPTPGKNLYLNIDLRLQQAAAQAFGAERGGLVVIDPNNGAVLALVSQPGFDPHQFVNGIPAKLYDELTNSPDRPLFNRALRGQYPPGSTVKPVEALGGLETGKITLKHSLYCPGHYALPGSSHLYRDWKKEGHGTVGVSDAIIQSCDVFFYDLANRMGIDQLSDYLKGFGFGSPTGIDVPGESKGLMPNRAWKQKVFRQPWFPGETLIAGIGQGYVLATPIQLANYVAGMAARGQRFQPQVVMGIGEAGSPTMELLPPKPLPPVPVINPEHWDRTIGAMTEVVHGARGTAKGISRNITYQIAGKTGTAQVFTIKQNERYVEANVEKSMRDHALFVAFAPADKPQMAAAVIMENGGHGGSAAAPIVRAVFDRFLVDTGPVTLEALMNPPGTANGGIPVNGPGTPSPAAPAAPAPAAPAPARPSPAALQPAAAPLRQEQPR